MSLKLAAAAVPAQRTRARATTTRRRLVMVFPVSSQQAVIGRLRAHPGSRTTAAIIRRIGPEGGQIGQACEPRHRTVDPWPWALALPGRSASFRASSAPAEASRIQPPYSPMAEPNPRHLRVVDSAPDVGTQPRVWLLLGERQGDNAQVLALGRALTRELGWPHETKQIYYDDKCEIPFRDRGASLIGIDLERSDRLSAPWPDIVIAIGRRAAPISRWLKEQTNGRLLNVHLGRPRMGYQYFDLIFTTPQYGLPGAPNVTKFLLPIILHDDAQLEAEAKRWLPQFEGLPRPW